MPSDKLGTYGERTGEGQGQKEQGQECSLGCC